MPRAIISSVQRAILLVVALTHALYYEKQQTKNDLHHLQKIRRQRPS